MDDGNLQRASEDLKIIRSIMENCTIQQKSAGIYFKIWGLLIPFSTIVTFILAYREKGEFIGILWGVTVIVGWLVSFSIGLKREGRRKGGIGKKIYTAIWGGFLLCLLPVMTLAVFDYFAILINLKVVMMLIALLLAYAVFLSGALSGSKMLKIVAAGWWLTGIICLFIPAYAASILLGIVTFFLSFIPGVILDKEYKHTTME